MLTVKHKDSVTVTINCAANFVVYGVGLRDEDVAVHVDKPLLVAKRGQAMLNSHYDSATSRDRLSLLRVHLSLDFTDDSDVPSDGVSLTFVSPPFLLWWFRFKPWQEAGTTILFLENLRTFPRYLTPSFPFKQPVDPW